MGHARTLGVFVLGLMLATATLGGQSGPNYRDYQLGSDLASVSAVAGTPAADATVIHQRPALLQDLQWRRPYTYSGATAAPVDPVQQIVFSFYNDKLFKLVVEYDRDRTAGMTDADMVDGLSAVFGLPVKPTVQPARALTAGMSEESGTRVARWGDKDYSAILYRSTYPAGFRMIVTSVPLDALARTAVTQALRLDEREAPQREVARQKKEADDERAAQDKARLANKAGFRP